MDKLLNKTDELINNALKAWGIKEFNLDSIDPLVRLLIACVADESNKLENSMSNAASELEQLLINSLLPWSLSGSRPAYGMVQAMPHESLSELDHNQCFFYEKSIPLDGNREQINIVFSPVTKTKIFRASIAHMFNGTELHAFQSAESFFPENPADTGNSIWLGVNLDESITSLNGFSLFIYPQKTWFDQKEIPQLLAAEGLRIFHNKQEIKIREGLDFKSLTSLSNHLFKSRSPNALSYFELIQSCFDTYRSNYFKIHAHDPVTLPLKRIKYPSFFKNAFKNDVLSQFQDELIWLELRLPPSAPLMAKQSNAFINTFPVVNLNRTISELSREEPIIKINTEKGEEFSGVLDFDAFDMFHNLLKPEKSDVVPFMVRSIEMEQFTAIDAANKLEKIIDSFENSFHVFYQHFSLDHDDIERLHAAVKPIRESLLDVKKSKSSGDHHYLIFNPENEKEIESLQVESLSTHGEHGNDIFQGELLKTRNALIDAGSLRFVTKTRGGSKKPHNDEKKWRIQSLLRGHNAIVTKDDILQHCFLYLNEKLKDATVTDSVMLIGENIRKCLKVSLLLDKDFCSKEDASFISKEVEYALKRKASTLVPVIVKASLI